MLQFGDGARPQGLPLVAAVVVRLAGQADVHLAGERLGHEAGHGAAIDHEADQCAPDGTPAMKARVPSIGSTIQV